MTSSLPRFAPVAALLVATTACVLLWVPLTVLPILDGLLAYVPPLDIARDIGLLMLLSTVPAALLAAVAQGVFMVAGRMWTERAPTLAWSSLVLPLLAIDLRQFGRMVWLWATAVMGSAPHITAPFKTAMAGVLLVTVLWLLRRVGWTLAIARIVGALQSGRSMAVALLLAAMALAAVNPPHFKPMASRAAPEAREANTALRGILVLSLDAVSALDADVCDPGSTTMPRLAAFARSATCFQRFYSASNFTTAGTATIESGLLPWSHFATQPDSTMSPASRRHVLPAALAAAGWRTHSITDNLLASPRQRGSFDSYDSAWISKSGLGVTLWRDLAALLPDTTLPRLVPAALAFLAPGAGWPGHAAESPFRSEAVYADLDRLLRQEQSSPQPQFIWAHTLPPHSPYLPPPSTKYRLLPAGELDRMSDLLPDNIEYPPERQALVDKHRLRYRESLMAADMALGQWLDAMQARGDLDRYIIVITTDHGESFQGGFLGHAGSRLTEPLIRGPLVVRLPAQRGGRIVTQAVSQADLAPTLLDLAGLPPLPSAEGRSLKPLLVGQDLPDRPVLAMAMEHQTRFTPLKRGNVALIDGDFKLVLQLIDGQAHLFDLRRDPLEEHDLAASEAARTQALRAQIESHLRAAEARRGQSLVQ